MQWEIDAKKQRLMQVLSPLQYKASALQMNSNDDRCVIIHPSTRPNTNIKYLSLMTKDHIRIIAART